MLKKNFRLIVSTFVAGALIGSLMGTVFAASATSSSKSIGPVYGYSYTNYATISDDYAVISASTNISKVGAGTVPTAYMGTLARAYKDGAICVQTSMTYNSSAVSGKGSIVLGNPDCGAGIYHSQGRTEVYNGSGYDTYYTFLTPNINH